MSPKATLNNYLWIPKAAVKGSPSEFAPEWEHELPLLKTAEGRLQQQQISALRDELGGDLDIADLDENDKLIITNWTQTAKYWALCRGDYAKVLKLANRLGLPIEDRRADSPWPQEISDNLKMLMKPRDYQIEPFKKWLDAGYGIFHAAPAFGKTYLMIWLILTLRQRTLVLTHTDALAEQFITRFRKGSPSTDKDDPTYTPITNCLDVEAGLGKGLGTKIVGRYRGDEIYPVTVATWQSFISEGGRKAIKEHRDSFGLVLADESLPGGANILTEYGYKTIESIVMSPDLPRVFAFDGVKFVLRQVVKAWAHAPKSRMVEIVHERGVLRATANHPVLTTNGWVLAGHLRPHHIVICYADDRPKDIVNGWLCNGGCQFKQTTIKNKTPCAYAGCSRCRADLIGIRQVPGATGMVQHSPKGISELRLGRACLSLRDYRTGRDRGHKTKDVQRQESRRPATARGQLASGDDGMVDHGRREPVEWVPTPTHRELHSGRSARVSALGDTTHGLAGQTENFKGKVLDPDLRQGIVSGTGYVDSTACHTRYDVQDPSCLGAAQGLHVHPLWFLDNVPGREEHTLRKHEVLPWPGMPSSEFIDRLALVPWAKCREYLSENDGEELPALRKAHRSNQLLEPQVLSGGGVLLAPYPGASLSRVIHVRDVATPSVVYDLSVDKEHNFVVDGVVTHNCHVFAAPQAASVVNGFAARQRRGVSAIPTRKDQLEKALYDVLGPVTARGRMEQLRVTATMIGTGLAPFKAGRYPKRGDWSYLLNALAASTARNDIIYDWIDHDLSAGRHLLILAERRNWVLDLVARLKNDGIPCRAVLGRMDGAARDKAVQLMMDGKIKVIVATKVFKEGIDIAVLDTLYATAPLRNMQLLDNMLGRIRRPYPDKKDSVFRYFVDEGHGMLYGCARGTHKDLVNLGCDITMVQPGTKPAHAAFGDGYGSAAAESSLGRAKRGGLRAAAAKAPSSIKRLFEDLDSDAKSQKQFLDRMHGEKK